MTLQGLFLLIIQTIQIFEKVLSQEIGLPCEIMRVIPS